MKKLTEKEQIEFFEKRIEFFEKRNKNIKKINKKLKEELKALYLKLLKEGKLKPKLEDVNFLSKDIVKESKRK